jgi:hypothetical protein
VVKSTRADPVVVLNRKCRTLVNNFCRRKGSTGTDFSEDMTQEAVMRALAYAKKHDILLSEIPGGLLNIMTRRACIGVLRDEFGRKGQLRCIHIDDLPIEPFEEVVRRGKEIADGRISVRRSKGVQSWPPMQKMWRQAKHL